MWVFPVTGRVYGLCMSGKDLNQKLLPNLLSQPHSQFRLLPKLVRHNPKASIPKYSVGLRFSG